MNKKIIILIFSSIGLITSFLVIIGILFNKTEDEKINGLTEVYDVSVNGVIAYVSHSKGHPELYIKTEQEEKLALKLDVDQIITDMAFSPNGTTLAYSISDEEVEDGLESSVQLLDIRSLDSKNLFQKATYITELAFDPKDENKLFYLSAETYENYSPIARAYPHDIDVFSYHLSEDIHIQHTEMASYSINSLQVSPTEDVVYVQMDDVADDATAEEIFEMKQQIFQIPLDKPEQFSVISDNDRDIDIYDFALVPNKEAMVFQSVSNASAGGTFQYELYYYDWEQIKEKRLTDLQSYAAHPIITHDGKHVYFIVDRQFAKSHYPENYLYKMDIDGTNVKEITLEHN
ncbi:TolB family protein [Pseudogracilibacillus auburnensis]|uniref:TolB family protein n=1 Tax=Pseudogracilibacillus auburnensis TaxID=1494959 RepID=UPI001A958FCD|nr:hypothetical protein [Pseudogracilibacillus auburnensis]MBO1001356.1 hypothetical protein [Pseudogracilibacillus auburnensis]